MVKRKALRILVLAFVAVFILFILWLLVSAIGTVTHTRKLQITVSPTPKILSPTPRQEGRLKITLISPGREHLNSLSVITPVTLAFDKSIDPTSFDYEIRPEVKLDVELDASATKVTFKPTEIWIPNTTYTLTIKKAKSQKDAYIIDAYTIRFMAIHTADEEHASPVEATNNP